ncbi:PH domain-containing protein (plasmid) [Streptomyces sp. BI20]|uniref:PH domain-containing protein n=1 Tax=Streptomyces sp. BI20 TaxID=3403460 RepID=UPI003C75F329
MDPASALPRLRPPRNRPAPAALTWWRARALLTVSGPLLLLGLALAGCSALFFPGALPWLGPLLALTTLAPALAWQLLVPRRQHALHAWELGAHALHAADGRLLRRNRIVPLSRVQEVDVTRGPLRRRFGLSTLTVTTASTAGRIRVPGLTDATARELAAHVTRAAALAPADTP